MLVPCRRPVASEGPTFGTVKLGYAVNTVPNSAAPHRWHGVRRGGEVGTGYAVRPSSARWRTWGRVQECRFYNKGMLSNPTNLRRFSLRLLGNKEVMRSPEVLNPETIDHRRMKPKVRGLYCEILFGRIEKYRLNRHFWTSRRNLASQTAGSSYRSSVAEKARKDWFSTSYVSIPIHVPVRKRKSRSRNFLRLPRFTQVGHIKFPSWLMNCWYGTNQRNSILMNIFPIRILNIRDIINHDSNYVFLSDTWLLHKPPITPGLHCSISQCKVLYSYWGGKGDSNDLKSFFWR